MSTKIETLIAGALTSKGSDLIGHADLVDLQDAATRLGYVVQSVEAYQSYGDFTRPRLDATFSYPHSLYSTKWNDTVFESRNSLVLFLSTVSDKEKLLYQVWLDVDNSGL